MNKDEYDTARIDRNLSDELRKLAHDITTKLFQKAVKQPPEGAGKAVQNVLKELSNVYANEDEDALPKDEDDFKSLVVHFALQQIHDNNSDQAQRIFEIGRKVLGSDMVYPYAFAMNGQNLTAAAKASSAPKESLRRYMEKLMTKVAVALSNEYVKKDEPIVATKDKGLKYLIKRYIGSEIIARGSASNGSKKRQGNAS